MGVKVSPLSLGKMWSAVFPVFHVNASPQVWVSKTSAIALLAELWWNPCVISSDAKRRAKKAQTRLSCCFLYPSKVSGAPPTTARVPLKPALSFHSYSSSPPSLCMKGNGDEVVHLAFTGAAVCPSAAKQTQACHVAPSNIVFSDNRN